MPWQLLTILPIREMLDRRAFSTPVLMGSSLHAQKSSGLRLIVWSFAKCRLRRSHVLRQRKRKVKHVHPLFSDLLDLAIYSFGCQCGLRAHHKVRGGPVLEGVSAILGRMLLTSNPETKAAFEEMTPTRLGS